MTTAYIAFGSNLGDRTLAISQALKQLSAETAIRIAAVSRLYESAPVGGPPQGPFLNGVAEVETELAPRELLQRLKTIEHRLGRAPGGARWGPRPIDLDILFYGELVMEEPDLIIPHPRAAERLFVLEPLQDLAPAMRHPVLGKTVAELTAAHRAQREVG